MELSVVIPFYNEVENVGPLLQEVHNAVNGQVEFEIVAVDDGSKDGTRERMQELRTDLPILRIVRHRGNYGQSAAILSGVRAAQGDLIATLDGDGQNDPADIPALLAEYKRQFSEDRPLLIAGNRNKRQDTWIRKLSSRIANSVRRGLLQDDCSDTGCGLKLFPRDVFLRLPHFNHLHRFLPALFKRAGSRIVNLPVNHRPRMLGQSKYGVGNRLWVGIVDIFGVRWLQSRPCDAEVENELE